MRNDLSVLSSFADYIECRFGDWATVEYRFDSGVEIGAIAIPNDPECCEIEVYAPGENATIFAGPLRFESIKPGVAPVIQFLDLVTSFPIFEMRSVFGSRGLVRERPLSRLESKLVVRKWPSWTGAERSSEECCPGFVDESTSGSRRFRSFQTRSFWFG